MRKGKNAVNQYNYQVKKGIKDKKNFMLTEEEVAGLSNVPHHFTYHSAVFSAHSGATKVCLVFLSKWQQ